MQYSHQTSCSSCVMWTYPYHIPISHPKPWIVPPYHTSVYLLNSYVTGTTLLSYDKQIKYGNCPIIDHICSQTDRRIGLIRGIIWKLPHDNLCTLWYTISADYHKDSNTWRIGSVYIFIQPVWNMLKHECKSIYMQHNPHSMIKLQICTAWKNFCLNTI